MESIKIYKTTYGSDPASMGEIGLSYTNGISDYAKNICSYFSDSSGELNPNHASFMMFYNPSDDRFVFSHIQAQEWIFEGGARRYPFRGAYEVSRADYKAFKVSDIIKALPRINPNQPKQGNVPVESKIVNSAHTSSPEAQKLSLNIQSAITQGKYLCIKFKTDGEKLRENAIFESKYFCTLLQAIDILPKEYKEYATFLFLADKNYERYFERCAVNLYAADSEMGFSFSNAIMMDWQDVISKEPKEAVMKLPNIPTDNNRCKTLKEVFQYVRNIPMIEKKVAASKYSEITKEGWETWLNSGHELSSLVVKSKAVYVQLLDVFKDIEKSNKTQGVAQRFANTVITKTFLEGLNIRDEQEVLFWETQIRDYKLWTEDLAKAIWAMWGGVSKATVSSLIEYINRNSNSKFKSMVMTNDFKCNGFGALKKYEEKWERAIVYQNIKNKFDFSRAENFPEISNKIKDNKRLLQYVLNFAKYFSETDIKLLAQNCDQYIDTLDNAVKVDYIKKSKLIIWSLCECMQKRMRGGFGEKLQKKCEDILNPNRKRNYLIAAAFFVGALMGVASTLGYRAIFNGNPKTDANATKIVKAEDENVDQSIYYSQVIRDMPQLAQLYMQGRSGTISFNNGSINIGNIEDVEMIYPKLQNISDSTSSIKLAINEYSGDEVNGKAKYTDIIREVSRDSTLFMIIKDLPKGSRLDHIKDPSNENKLLVDIPNNSKYKADELPDGDCPLTYYFWLIEYLESPSVKDKLGKINIAY